MRHKDVPEGNADALPGTAIPPTHANLISGAKKCSVFLSASFCCKTRVLQRVSCPCGCVCVSLRRGWPGKKLVKRLAVMVKGCTFAIAFGKQGLVWPLRSGGGIKEEEFIESLT